MSNYNLSLLTYTFSLAMHIILKISVGLFVFSLWLSFNCDGQKVEAQRETINNWHVGDTQVPGKTNSQVPVIADFSKVKIPHFKNLINKISKYGSIPISVSFSGKSYGSTKADLSIFVLKYDKKNMTLKTQVFDKKYPTPVIFDWSLNGDQWDSSQFK